MISTYPVLATFTASSSVARSAIIGIYGYFSLISINNLFNSSNDLFFLIVQSSANTSQPASTIADAFSNVGVIKISSNGSPSPKSLKIPITGRVVFSLIALTS